MRHQKQTLNPISKQRLERAWRDSVKLAARKSGGNLEKEAELVFIKVQERLLPEIVGKEVEAFHLLPGKKSSIHRAFQNFYRLKVGDASRERLEREINSIVKDTTLTKILIMIVNQKRRQAGEQLQAALAEKFKKESTRKKIN